MCAMPHCQTSKLVLGHGSRRGRAGELQGGQPRRCSAGRCGWPQRADALTTLPTEPPAHTTNLHAQRTCASATATEVKYTDRVDVCNHPHMQASCYPKTVIRRHFQRCAWSGVDHIVVLNAPANPAIQAPRTVLIIDVAPVAASALPAMQKIRLFLLDGF